VLFRQWLNAERGFRYAVLEFEPLLDSSSIDSKGWAEIAQTIFRNYKLFDGFVVLHGTDSLAYTASALSFMLQNLGKPVILTGRLLRSRVLTAGLD
jgi:60kDa lysophospholipase